MRTMRIEKRGFCVYSKIQHQSLTFNKFIHYTHPLPKISQPPTYIILYKISLTMWSVQIIPHTGFKVYRHKIYTHMKNIYIDECTYLRTLVISYVIFIVCTLSLMCLRHADGGLGYIQEGSSSNIICDAISCVAALLCVRAMHLDVSIPTIRFVK